MRTPSLNEISARSDDLLNKAYNLGHEAGIREENSRCAPLREELAQIAERLGAKDARPKAWSDPTYVLTLVKGSLVDGRSALGPTWADIQAALRDLGKLAGCADDIWLQPGGEKIVVDTIQEIFGQRSLAIETGIAEERLRTLHEISELLFIEANPHQHNLRAGGQSGRREIVDRVRELKKLVEAREAQIRILQAEKSDLISRLNRVEQKARIARDALL